MIITTTLCGPSHIHLLRFALASVKWANVRLVIDTSPAEYRDPSPVSKCARRHGAVAVRWPWPSPTDYAAARNEALRRATSEVQAMLDRYAGAVWALTVDADEVMLCSDDNALREQLFTTRADVVEMRHADAGYTQPRLIRLPTRGRWVGPAHEFLELEGVLESTSRIHWSEIDKGPEDLRAKWESDLAALLPYVRHHPQGRWHFYIARAYFGLGRHHDALVHYEICANAEGHDELRAMARYQGACVLTQHLGNHQAAIRWCALGMTHHAGIGELAWVAALAAHRLGQIEQAVCWAEIAKAHGRGTRAERARRSFRDDHALDMLDRLMPEQFMEAPCRTTS